MDYRNYIRNNILDKIETPIVTSLHKLKISPNLLSVFGLILGIIAAVFIALDDLIFAALFLLIGAIADLFDGSLARKFNKGLIAEDIVRGIPSALKRLKNARFIK